VIFWVWIYLGYYKVNLVLGKSLVDIIKLRDIFISFTWNRKALPPLWWGINAI